MEIGIRVSHDSANTYNHDLLKFKEVGVDGVRISITDPDRDVTVSKEELFRVLKALCT